MEYKRKYFSADEKQELEESVSDKRIIQLAISFILRGIDAGIYDNNSLAQQEIRALQAFMR